MIVNDQNILPSQESRAFRHPDEHNERSGKTQAPDVSSQNSPPVSCD